MDEISVLIADDHTLFRKGVRKMLEAEEDVKVVGEAATGREALEQARTLMPDVILMDIKMPDLDGIEATRTLRGEMPHIGIIFVTMFDEDEFVFRGLRAGGRGYILKDADPETMLRAIRAVVAGQVYLSPAIAGTVVEAMKAGRSEGESSAFAVLTDRERAVLQLLAEGHSSKEIAARLHVSIKTVGTHREHIMEKLDISSIAGLTKYAIREGLTKP